MYNNNSSTPQISFTAVRNTQDCRNVIRCLRSAFGDSYIKKELYSPEQTLDILKSGRLSLYLAHAEDGEVMGVIGWEQLEMFPSTAELCTLVVLPQYRRLGLGAALIRYVFDVVKGLDITSVYGYPIASHIKAQRSIEQLSPVCCGFLPSVFSTQRFSSGISGHTNPKDSLTVVCFNLKKKNAGTLRLKARYHSLAKSVYGGLGVLFSAEDFSAAPTAETTLYKYRYDDTHCTLYINIDTVGRDFGQLTEVLCYHKSNPDFTAQVCLDMCDPAAVYAADILEKAGMLFSGFHPLCGEKEYCIYHYRGAVPLDIGDLEYTEGQKIFADCLDHRIKELTP